MHDAHEPCRPARALVGLVVAAGMVAVWALTPAGCTRSASPPSPSLDAAAAPAPAQDPSAPEVAGAEVVHPEVSAALAAIVDRHKCNRLMGCAPRDLLRTHGAAALPAILALLDTAKTRDGYWIIALLGLLGETDDPRSVAALEARLGDGRWEVRTRAALSLAALAPEGSRAALEAALAPVRRGEDVAFEAAVLYALDRLGATVDERPAREALVARLTLDFAALSRLNPGFFAALTEVIRRARVSEALPVVRLGITHRDRFVRVGAIEAAAALKDPGAIPFLVGRLDDVLPSVRRGTLAALVAITGATDRGDAAAWKAWCEATDCRADVLTGLPAGTPSGPPTAPELPALPPAAP
jgi:HEAT repeat protein